MAAQKACERDILWTVSWIAFKCEVAVLYLFLINFWNESIKNNRADDSRFVKKT